MKRQFVDNLYNGGCNINNAKQRSDFDTFAARLNDVYENDEYQLSWYDQQYEHPRSSRTNTCHKTQNTDTAESMTIQAVLVSARPSAEICSFHEPEQVGPEGRASSLQLQLSGTHCRFTFDPRPSVTVSFEQGSRLIFSGCSLSLTFPLKTAEEIELN